MCTFADFACRYYRHSILDLFLYLASTHKFVNQWSLLIDDITILLPCSTTGSVNPAGDTMQSIAYSLGLSDVLRYLDGLSADLKGISIIMMLTTEGFPLSLYYVCMVLAYILSLLIVMYSI